ncbi:hypothetical protein J6590_041394 [Homalodisca vitripennis]|nr:hypothetical protein J6590_041394 [Homalodisca vitripennis]
MSLCVDYNISDGKLVTRLLHINDSLGERKERNRPVTAIEPVLRLGYIGRYQYANNNFLAGVGRLATRGCQVRVGVGGAQSRHNCDKLRLLCGPLTISRTTPSTPSPFHRGRNSSAQIMAKIALHTVSPTAAALRTLSCWGEFSSIHSPLTDAVVLYAASALFEFPVNF